MKVRLLFCIALLCFSKSGLFSQPVDQSLNEKNDLVDWVNPYIGNIERLMHPTFPTVHLPNSFLRICPARDDYTDVTLDGLPLLRAGKGISAFHLSPYQGDRDHIKPIISYTYDNEEITPYSYSVILDEQETEIHLGVSRQSALYQIKFNGGKDSYIILSSENGDLHWDGTGVSGYQWLKNETKVYMYLIADQLPDSIFALEGEALIEKINSDGRHACLVLKYPGTVENISLRYGISFIDEKQARDNLKREVESKNLDELHSEGRQIWNEALSKIKVKGGTSDNRSVFYTALYRTFYRPVSISENGRYYSAADGKVYPDHGKPFYVDDVAWDTHRALHPLTALIEPDKELNILHSYLRMADHMDNFRMPENIDVTGNYPAIHSNHIIVSFLDAYNKGLRDFDLERAFNAGKNAVMQRTLAPVADGPSNDLNRFYQNHGYVPSIWHTEKETVSSVDPERKRMAVSVTLGTAYDDWALSQLAEKMGNEKEQQYFSNRSVNYRNLFNSRTGFFHPKDAQGEFLMPFDYELSGGQNGYMYYTDGNAWSYRFGLRYNIDDLIGLNGGRATFASRLDHLFTKSLGLSRFRHYLQFPTQTGMVGGFAMGNEHSFHIPYLYNYTGQPWKTQERIHGLLKQWFRNDLMGMPGDDDGGAMSAFAVFSLMGVYPVTPGIPVYNIGCPHFEHVRIETDKGENFEIVAENLSPANKYIQAATLNGVPLNRPWLYHRDILKGGKLVLKMGSKPNTKWGIAPEAAPPSKPN